MEKIIVLDGKEYRLSTNAYTPIAYKKEFGIDYFKDLFNMVKGQAIMSKLEEMGPDEELTADKVDISMLEEFDMLFFYRLFWVFAKSANPRIKTFDNFFMEMESFPLEEVGPVLMEMLAANIRTKKSQMSRKRPVKKSSR